MQKQKKTSAEKADESTPWVTFSNLKKISHTTKVAKPVGDIFLDQEMH